MQATDIHSYFPEWADRPAQDGTLLESDHNSYMAGGYAEEFGYQTQQGEPPPFPHLDGDPERSAQWRVQIAGLHPGYPECPRPVDREVARAGNPGPVRTQSPAALVSSDAAYHTGESAEPSHGLSVDFTVIHVGERSGAARKHPWLPVALTLRWKDFLIRRRELGRLF